MSATIASQKKLAEVIGWRKVTEDSGFTSYDYRKDLSKRESITYLLKIFDEQTDSEFYQTLFVIKSVLPKELRKKVDKITRKIKPEEIAGVIDILRFAIEQHKARTTFEKLKKYGETIGLDITKLGYEFTFELSPKTRQEIITQIESKLPMEIAPRLGKIKKIDYKIATLKEFLAERKKEEE